MCLCCLLLGLLQNTLPICCILATARTKAQGHVLRPQMELELKQTNTAKYQWRLINVYHDTRDSTSLQVILDLDIDPTILTLVLGRL